MKYTNLRAFEKHLKDAAPDHFSSVYFLIGKDKEVRREAELALIKAILKERAPIDHSFTAFDAESAKIDTILAELNSASFFATQRIISLRNGEKLKKEATAKLEAYFDAPSHSNHLIISAEAVNRGTKFYKKGEKTGIILDLPEEKLWEKENSLAQKAATWAKTSGKNLPPQTARYLVQYTGSDQALLQSEMDKLICYLGEQDTIQISDIHNICIGLSTETGWQLADAIFKRDTASALRISHALLQDGTAFFALIRQIRSQFQNKLHIATILSEGGGPDAVQRHFPYMRGQILGQNIQLATGYGKDQLSKGILTIDETELRAKNSSTKTDLLTELLIIKLTGRS